MAFSKEFIQQIKTRVRIKDLASDYTELRLVGEGIYRGRCPHPDHNDGDPSFTVWEKTNSWACLGCHNGKKDVKNGNYGSDAIAFAQWMHGDSWQKAVIRLSSWANIPLEEDKHSEAYRHNFRLARAYNHNLNAATMKYLKDRGLSLDTIKKWLIGFDGSRITFPLFDQYSQIVGFTKRKYVETSEYAPKYRNSPTSEIFNKRKYFYGAHVLDSDFPELRITEGAVDVLLPYQYGVKNILAPLGTAFTEDHAKLVKAMNKTPVFCMDGDKAGIGSMNKSIRLLAQEGVFSKVLVLPEGMDMADMALKEKDSLEDYIRKNALTYSQYLLRSIVSQYNSRLSEIRMDVYPEVSKIIDQIHDETEKKVAESFVYEHMKLRMH